jgi:hypothetical protein
MAGNRREEAEARQMTTQVLRCRSCAAGFALRRIRAERRRVSIEMFDDFLLCCCQA